MTMPENVFLSDTERSLPHNPVEAFLRMDRMPHIWCPGCGIGTTVNCFAHALETSGLELDKIAIVSGIGCSGRVAGYLNLDSFHTTHGRAIPFATGLKLANPNLKVVVYSGDGDLTAIGGNHFIHAARRNVDMTVILVNNFIYGMTGGQVAPTTPLTATASTAPYGNFEQPFNLPYLAESCGAVYVARWTAYHVRYLTKAMKEAVQKKGFSFVEVIAPCPTLYSRRNKLGDGLDQMVYYKDHSEIRNGADTKTVGLDFQSKIVLGKFVDKDRPTYLETMNEYYSKHLGDGYTLYTG
jgi:2-oxoglutarate/2-oxoacid ferredoxin oxidoreductase subunit beta